MRLASEASIRRAYQRLNSTMLARTDEPCTAYRGESPRLLQQALELCERPGTPIADLANELKWSPARIRELLGQEDLRPKLQLVK